MLKDSNKYLNYAGFTLIELFVTIAIAGIVLSIAVPSFQNTIRNARLTANINQVVTALNLARSEAIKRNLPVSVRRSSTEWESGWTVFVDIDGDGINDAGDDTLLRVFDALPNNYTLRTTNFNRITYQPSGMSGNGSFVLCDSNDGNTTPEANTSRLVIINTAGRIRMGADSDNNGIPEKDKNGTMVDITSCTASPFT